MQTRRRILFAISDTGGGHRSAAQALVAGLEELAGDSVECDVVDILRLTDLPLVRAAPELYDWFSTHWLSLYDAGYLLTDGRRRIGLLLNLIYLRAQRRLNDELQRRCPQLVVVVHPLAARLVALTRRAARLPYRIATVVTDLVSLHASWSYPKVDRCIVPTHEALSLMRRRGVPGTQLTLSGFPVHPKFMRQGLSRAAARHALGLDPDRFTVLLTNGGVGAGRLQSLADRLRREFPTLQQLVVTGHNQLLYQRLQGGILGPHSRVYGFVDNLEQLMAASDVVVSKAGPGTIMEALTMHRPVIVTEAVGLQERGNINFVLNHELGAYCPTNQHVVAALHALLDPAGYQATVARLALATPRNGALQTARLLLEEVARH